jgi:hypothetical protein
MSRHFEEGVVGYGAGKLDVWFDAPVIPVRKEGGMVEEKTFRNALVVSS